MKVSKIVWNNRDADEATVTVGDGTFAVDVFCQPCKFSIGQSLSLLHCLDAKEMMTVEKSTADGFQKRDGFFNYSVVGVVGGQRSYVQVGDLKIHAGHEVPGDVSDGDRVIFNANRLSC